MAYLNEQDKIQKQAKVTAIADGLVNKSNDVVGQSEYTVSAATPAQDTTVRFGGPSATEKSLTNISNKSALITQKVAINRQINANNEFIATFDDPTKSWNNDPVIVSARQQVQSSTLQLQTSYAKINDTLATIDGASTQIQATAAPAIATQDTASRDVTNTTSPATVAAGTSTLPIKQLSNLKKLAGSNSNLGVIPNVSNKTEPGAEKSTNSKISLTTPVVGVTANKQDPDAVDVSKVIPNVLHDYPSYTYGLSLHLLTAVEYNKIVEKGEYVPNRVLIASAGRYDGTPTTPGNFKRAPYFAEDFYFDNLELETIIGQNAQSRNSNAIQYRFNLVEPYGFTLLDRIINLCNDPEVGCPNYLDMPYLLQIDFFGINEAGEIIGAIPDTTKRIPIRLLKMDVKMSVRGTEYSIQGVPYNHSAFDITTVTTPANFEIQAGTVAEFFQSDESAGGTTDMSAQRETAQASLWTSTSGQLVGPDGQFTSIGQINTSLLSPQTQKHLGLTKSYGTALNKWQQAAFDANKIGVNDKYFFNFIDKEIADSPFTSFDISSPHQTGMAVKSNAGTIKPAYYKSNLGLNMSTYDPTQRIFQINAGTYIDRVISWVIRNSTFITSQLEGIVPEEQKDLNTYLLNLAAKKDIPLYWFKVVPSVRLIAFDNVRKIWAREITYHIQKYEIRNVKVDVSPQGTAKNPVKAYNYIYTGQNKDILDLDIQFNTTYYTALTVYRDASAGDLATASLATKTNNPEGYVGNSNALKDPNAIMPLVMKPVVLDAGNRASGGSNTPRQVAVSDLEASLSSPVDMLVIDLTIIGDPSYIKQDDVFWTPVSNAQVSENKTNADPRLTFDGSLKMDNGEVYVSLVFRTPTDIDESTGLMKFDSKMSTSLFSGLYRVMKITNEFRSGQFTQKLVLTRLPRQGKLDHGSNKTPTSDNRNSVPGQQAILDNYLQGPNFTTPDLAKIATAADDAAQSAQQAQNNGDNAEPNIRTAEEDSLVEIRALAPEEPITETNLMAQVPPPPQPKSPTAAISGAVFDGISASDVQYLRSQSAALGLNPNALNGYLTNRLQDYEPQLRAKVAADTVKLKEILRKRNQ